MVQGQITPAPQASLPPARRVYQVLRQRVVAGEYPPGQKMPTERELGEELGVSRLTVAKAMAQLVVERRVERFRGRGTFVTAREVRNGGDTQQGQAVRRVTFVSPGRETRRVVVQQGVLDLFRHGVLEGLHTALRSTGCLLDVDFYADLETHLNCLARTDDEHPPSAFVLWPDPDPRVTKRVEGLIARRFPLVLIDTYLPELDCDYVVSDNVLGAQRMVEHLVSLGHQRIVYLTETPDRTSVSDRLTGFLRGLVCAGQSTHARSVRMIESMDEATVHATVRDLFESDHRPTALFTSHDSLAITAYAQLQQLGLRVPTDVSLAGFDGIDSGAHFTVPLTTIRQDFYEMGRLAGHVLLERFEGRAIHMRYQKQIAPELQVRASTAAPAGNS